MHYIGGKKEEEDKVHLQEKDLFKVKGKSCRITSIINQSSLLLYFIKDDKILRMTNIINQSSLLLCLYRMTNHYFILPYEDPCLEREREIREKCRATNDNSTK